MIPEQLAVAIAIQRLVLVALAGAVSGLVISAILRRPWNWRVLAVDIFTADATTILLALVGGLFHLWKHAVHDWAGIFMLAGSTAPVICRLLTATSRRNAGY